MMDALPMERTRFEARLGALRKLGAGRGEAEELLASNERHFQLPERELTLPLADEPFAATWQAYAEMVRRSGTLRSLEPYLPQLRFPIEAGISRGDGYRAATELGQDNDGGGLQLADPERCEVAMHETPAGAIATMTAANRDDFVRLVQAFGRKNEPEPVPRSMGALLISGYRNWHRIRQVQENHDAASVRDILRDKGSYQDRFILLSRDDYSGVPARHVGLDRGEWRQLSWLIRREHEAAHYFCRRVLGSMRNHVHDELIADYCGMVSALGRFDAGWMLLFLGLEDHPAYRPGARLENYRGTPALSQRAFLLLRQLVYRAVLSLDRFDRDVREDHGYGRGWPAAAMAIASLHVEELAGEDAPRHLLEAYGRCAAQVIDFAGEEILQ